MNTADALLIFLLLVQVWDAISTLYVIGHGGCENNPVMRKLMLSIGEVPALAVKLGVIGAAILLTFHDPMWQTEYGLRILGLLTGLYLYFVVFGNTRAAIEIFRRKS